MCETVDMCLVSLFVLLAQGKTAYFSDTLRLMQRDIRP